MENAFFPNKQCTFAPALKKLSTRNGRVVRFSISGRAIQLEKDNLFTAKDWGLLHPLSIIFEHLHAITTRKDGDGLNRRETQFRDHVSFWVVHFK